MLTVSSKEVAELIGKRHDNFLRDIRKYIETLGEEAPKYFINGSYKDKLGKVRDCYNLTLAGCELIAGRMIGNKGRALKEYIVKTFYKKDAEDNLIKTSYTVQEVAQELGISERSVYRNIDKGYLTAEKVEVLVPVYKTLVTAEALNAFKFDRGIL